MATEEGMTNLAIQRALGSLAAGSRPPRATQHHPGTPSGEVASTIHPQAIINQQERNLLAQALQARRSSIEPDHPSPVASSGKRGRVLASPSGSSADDAADLSLSLAGSSPEGKMEPIEIVSALVPPRSRPLPSTPSRPVSRLIEAGPAEVIVHPPRPPPRKESQWMGKLKLDKSGHFTSLGRGALAKKAAKKTKIAKAIKRIVKKVAAKKKKKVIKKKKKSPKKVKGEKRKKAPKKTQDKKKKKKKSAKKARIVVPTFL
jgi:hypothetical protein